MSKKEISPHNLIPIIDSEIIPREQLFPSLLQKIAQEREKPGTSETLIPQIENILNHAEKLGRCSVVVQLYQEEFLSAQHMVMEEKSKGPKGGSKLRTIKGLLTMKNSIRDMTDYQEAHHDQIEPVVKARSFRFLGRYADYRYQYKQSEEFYKKSLEFFDSQTEPKIRYHRLELLGFISYSLINQGKEDRGLNLMDQVLADYDQSVEGQWLKSHDYYTWAVWKSGVEIRTAKHLIEHSDSTQAKELINDAETILKMPDGNTEIFGLRIGELNHLKASIH